MKKISKKWSFGDLPPRVIIHDILTFYSFTIIGKNDNRYCLFGFFQRDRSRNIWFVFSSLMIRIKEFRSNMSYVLRAGPVTKNSHIPYINVSKLFHIGIHDLTPDIIDKECFCWDLYERLNEYSQKMYSLRSISFYGDPRTKRTVESSKELFTGSSFPNLKSFHFSSNSNTIRMFDQVHAEKNWSLCDRTFFQNLETFSFDIYQPCYNALEAFFREDQEKFQNLKTLKIEGPLSMKKEVCLKLPKLRKLIVGSSNVGLVVIPNGELRILRCTSLVQNFGWKRLISESPKLVCLEAISSHRTCDQNCWFLDPGVINHSLSYLKKLMIGGFKLNQKDMESWDRLRNQLEEIKIGFISFEDLDINIFHQRNYNSLRKLRLDLRQQFFKPNMFNFMDCYCSKNLSDLSIYNYSYPSINNEGLEVLFQKNEFPFLTVLSIAGNVSISGKHWVKLPSLRELYLELWNEPLFGDDFFREHLHELSNLEELVLSRLNIEGKGWERVCFENLKVLHIIGCERISESFFEENEFPCIEELCFSGKNLTGVRGFHAGFKVLVRTDEERKGLMKKWKEICLGSK